MAQGGYLLSDSERDLDALLQRYLRASSKVMLVLEAARETRLPNWRLFSGAVYQTVWNALTGRPAGYGVRDYDVAYFDADLSEKAEAILQAKVLAHVPDTMRMRVEVVNQARVHIWFQNEFGYPYAALTGTDDALRRSLFTAHAVGVRLEPDDSLTIAAPYGLGDIFDMVLRPNSELEMIGAHAEKAREALERWPELVVA
jgi:hypothetical protein